MRPADIRSGLLPLSEAGWRATRGLVRVPTPEQMPELVPVDLPGGRTVVADIGPRDAPPIILLHSVACTGLLTWYPVLDTLRTRQRVILFDQRWHGQGIRSRRFSLDDCARDALAVADAMGIDRFTIAGYSMGGLVAQLVAHAAPERVDGMVLCATASRFRRGARQRRALTLLERSLRGLRARAGRAVGRRAVTARPADDIYRWALNEVRQTSPWAIATAVDAIGRFDSSGWLHTVRAPSAVVVTARDGAIAPDHQRSLLRVLPDSAGYEADAGHAACVLAAAEFVPAFLAACASVRSRAR